MSRRKGEEPKKRAKRPRVPVRTGAVPERPPRITYPWGPQHPALPEALQLLLTCEDEKVLEVRPVFGYMHRGIEKAAEQKPFDINLLLCERICGVCSFSHALSYCQLMEEMMGVEVPPRARYLRVVWSELSRLQSHFMGFGLLADALGFEHLSMQCWRVRERVLDILEMTTGQRIIPSVCSIGGVRRDLTPDLSRRIQQMLKHFRSGVKDVASVWRKDYTIKSRMVGKGVLSGERAWTLGAVGPTLRGSGRAWDCRSLGYAAYGELDFEPLAENGGDSYARLLLRLREVQQSCDLILEALVGLPQGPVAIGVQGFPNGEAVMRVEQPRGELLQYGAGNGTAYLERLHMRTPTYANLPALMAMLPGCQIADVPVVVLSIDPCIACAER